MANVRTEGHDEYQVQQDGVCNGGFAKAVSASESDDRLSIGGIHSQLN